MIIKGVNWGRCVSVGPAFGELEEKGVFWA